MNEVGYISIAVIIFFLTSGILIRRIKKYRVADDIHWLTINILLAMLLSFFIAMIWPASLVVVSVIGIAYITAKLIMENDK